MVILFHPVELIRLKKDLNGHLVLSLITGRTSLTPCLMHRCVCIRRYILENYNYKLHFQNLSIPHSACIHGDLDC